MNAKRSPAYVRYIQKFISNSQEIPIKKGPLDSHVPIPFYPFSTLFYQLSGRRKHLVVVWKTWGERGILRIKSTQTDVKIYLQGTPKLFLPFIHHLRGLGGQEDSRRTAERGGGGSGEILDNFILGFHSHLSPPQCASFNCSTLLPFCYLSPFPSS